MAKPIPLHFPRRSPDPEHIRDVIEAAIIENGAALKAADPALYAALVAAVQTRKEAKPR